MVGELEEMVTTVLSFLRRRLYQASSVLMEYVEAINLLDQHLPSPLLKATRDTLVTVPRMTTRRLPTTIPQSSLALDQAINPTGRTRHARSKPKSLQRTLQLPEGDMLHTSKPLSVTTLAENGKCTASTPRCRTSFR